MLKATFREREQLIAHYEGELIPGPQGPAGPQGVGISTIEKTGTSGLVDTYTITLTNGDTTTFEVTNGEDGEVTTAAMNAAIEAALSAYSEGDYPDMQVGGLISDEYITDNAPYIFRPTAGGKKVGNREWNKLVGGTVAWNQLVQNGNFADMTGWYCAYSTSASNNVCTISTANAEYHLQLTKTGLTFPVGHKVLVRVSVKPSFALNQFHVRINNDTAQRYMNLSANVWNRYETIANAPNGTTAMRFYDSVSNISPNSTIEIKEAVAFDLTQMFGSTIADYVYSLEQSTAGSGIAWLQQYDYFTEDYYAFSNPTLQSVEATAHVTKDANDTIIDTYPIDSDLVLRGIPKLTNGVLSYDGDIYEWDGTVTRNYGTRAYQAGDESLTDAITDGTNTVYKLTIPTTESADPFTAVQTVEEGGTEEFVTGNKVPVGNVSVYRRA